MRISILTFSKEANFGATLQCYALSKYIQQIGHQVQIIDIQLPESKETGLLYRILIKFSKYLFFRFRKKHLNNFTKKYKNEDELRNDPPKSDLYIVGSDQVWNPEITKRLNPYIYFFSFLPDKAKRISYAASFGTETWHENKSAMTNKIKQLLEKFSSISVRENSGIKICLDTFNLNATEVLDPTFLINSYNEIISSQKITNKKYILYFKFIKNENVAKNALDLAKKNNLQIIYLNFFKPKKGFRYKPYITVESWLSAIQHAEFIITDSFHCTVFSILFNRPFIVLPSNKERAGRMINLLEKFNLSERFCDNEDIAKRIAHLYRSKINYTEINEKVDNLRKLSQQFLKTAIEKVNE